MAPFGPYVICRTAMGRVTPQLDVTRKKLIYQLDGYALLTSQLSIFLGLSKVTQLDLARF